MRISRLAISCAMLLIPPAQAEIYMIPDAFIAEAFGGQAPPPKTLWVTGALAKRAEAVLEHAPELQVRYWAAGARSAWILDEIGKTEPITLGVVIDNDKIAAVRVLEYRESRGGEVRHPFFTNQFIGLGLTEDASLNEPVDGISGVTLSVRALDRMARFSLLLHQQIPKDGKTTP